MKNVLEWLNNENTECYGPIPIKKLNGKIIFTDCHTRAFVIYKMGIAEICCIWDTDILDLELYQNCFDWCLNVDISNISHLNIINHYEYKILWYNRCERLMNELSKQW